MRYTPGMLLLALAAPTLSFAADFLQTDAAGAGMHAQVNILREAGGFVGTEVVTTDCADVVVTVVGALDRNADPATPILGAALSTVFFVRTGAANADCEVLIDGIPLDPLSAGIDNQFHIVSPEASPVDGGTNDMDGTVDGVITLSASLRSPGGTLVLAGLDVPVGTSLVFDTSDPNSGTEGNEAFLPVILLVDGAASIDGTIDLSGLDGDNAPAGLAADGGDGGPGGGGGGVGSNCMGAAVFEPGNGFTGGGGTAFGTCIEFTPGGYGAVEGPDFEDGGEGIFTDVANGALGYAGGVGGGTGMVWGTGGGGGYCCGTSGAGGYGGGGGNGHSDSSGWGGGGGGFGTSGENGVGTVGGAKSGYNIGGAGLANGSDSMVPFAGGSGGAGGDSGSGTADGAGGGGGGGALLLSATSLSIGSGATFALYGGDGGDTVGVNPGSSTGGSGGSGGGLHLAANVVNGIGGAVLDLTGGYGGREANGYYSGDGGEGRVRVDGAEPPSFGVGPTAAAASRFEGPSIVAITDTDLTISSDGACTLWIYDDTGAYVDAVSVAADGTVTLFANLAEGTNHLVLVDDDTEVSGPAGAATLVYTPDSDGDGFDAERYAGDDCDDAAAAVNPDGIEVCNGIDDDCDDVIDPDDATDADTWYADIDTDGYGDAATSLRDCEQPVGYVADNTDCDDTSTLYHPGADESDCTDPADYNCDGSVVYADADDDGFAACEECDDTTASAYPGATEVCDGIDNDCDLVVDPDTSVGASTWYADVDADLYGDVSSTTVACAAPAGYVADATDCDDTSDLYHPGASEADCTDPNDYNCDGSVGYADTDADKWAACVECDDLNSAVNPEAVEVCNLIDDNCDGVIDEAVTTTYYTDADGDTYGDLLAPVEVCEPADGQVEDATDCADADATIYPGATDVPDDGIDQDCDGIDAHEEPVDTGDTGDTGDTAAEDTAVVDSGDSAEGDSAVVDTGGPDDNADDLGVDEGQIKGGGGCGCASGGGAETGVGLLGLAALALRRRLRRNP